MFIHRTVAVPKAAGVRDNRRCLFQGGTHGIFLPLNAKEKKRKKCNPINKHRERALRAVEPHRLSLSCSLSTIVLPRVASGLRNLQILLSLCAQIFSLHTNYICSFSSDFISNVTSSEKTSQLFRLKSLSFVFSLTSFFLLFSNNSAY